MISKDKQYKTRDGREVRIYATDGDGSQSIHGAVLDATEWRIYAWYADGRYSRCEPKCRHDLIEVRPRIKRTVWLNVYADAISWWSTKEAAGKMATKGCLACVKVEIDCEEGEGL